MLIVSNTIQMWLTKVVYAITLTCYLHLVQNTVSLLNAFKLEQHGDCLQNILREH